jgi:FMN reductase (NADPH)
MISNPVIDALMNRKSIRKYREEQPSDEVVETIILAGQQAPFAMQMGSVLLSRKIDNNVFRAPLLFTVCIDVHRMERVMEQKGWKRKASDIYTLMFGIQDAAYMAENMVIAAESLGLGSCYIGAAPFMAKKIKEMYSLPDRILPLVMLTMGYPDEDPPVRPRYPLSFHAFEEEYPSMDDAVVSAAAEKMDSGYLDQDYYRKANFMIGLPDGMEETFDFDSYSWTEHISRKLGLWGEDPEDLLDNIRLCGFNLCPDNE